MDGIGHLSELFISIEIIHGGVAQDPIYTARKNTTHNFTTVSPKFQKLLGFGQNDFQDSEFRDSWFAPGKNSSNNSDFCILIKILVSFTINSWSISSFTKQKRNFQECVHITQHSQKT